MITVERKRMLAAPADRVRAVLDDVDQIPTLMPRAERVDVVSQREGRARIALTLRLGRLGTQRIEGEARSLADGLRFVAVQPMQIDVLYKLIARGNQTEVIARLATEVPKALAPVARWLPQRLIEGRVGQELDAALDGLERVVLARERG